MRIAGHLSLPEAAERDQSRAVAATQKWLETHTNWLLILDNADHPQEIHALIPRNPSGHILLTSRAQVFDRLGIKPSLVPPFPAEDAVSFLLNRTHPETVGPEERLAAEELARELGFLPLALEQAGAYITAKQTRFQDYLATYRTRRLKLLKKMGPVAGDYSHTVATAWVVNFQQVKQSSGASSDLLRLTALLSPDAIPLELLERGAQHFGQRIAKALKRFNTEPIVLDELIEPLTRYSLIQRDREARTYSMHPLIQEVLRATELHRMQIRAAWGERIVRGMAVTFPSFAFVEWDLFNRLLPQALRCTELIEECGYRFLEAARLLLTTGYALRLRRRYSDSERLVRRALAVWEQLLDPDRPDVATNLGELASLVQNLRPFAEAEPLLRRGLAIWEQVGAPDSLVVDLVLDCLAYLLVKQSRWAEAEPLLRRALAIREQLLSPDHEDVAPVLEILAGGLTHLRRYAEAEAAVAAGGSEPGATTGS